MGSATVARWSRGRQYAERILMDHVEFDREPPTNLTTLVVAFGGWIDAGRAATGALRHLVRDLPAPRLARIDPEEFFVFTQERPEAVSYTHLTLPTSDLV